MRKLLWEVFSRIEKRRRQEDWLGTMLELSGVWGHREAVGEIGSMHGNTRFRHLGWHRVRVLF